MGLPIHISAGIAVDPRNANLLYLTVWNPHWYYSGILYRGNATGQWSRIPTPDSVPNTPAINYRSNMVLDGTGTLYVTTHGYKLWRSQNADALDPNQVRWELVREFSPDVSVELLASGWGPSGLALYASIRQGQNKPTLHRSLDGGQTWAPLKINF
jgi:photosystem II stability/assembly factor-like uncharacterized protein